MTSALRTLERYTLYSKVSIHEAPVALHDMAFTYKLYKALMHAGGSWEAGCQQLTAEMGVND